MCVDYDQNSTQCISPDGHEAMLSLRVGVLDYEAHGIPKCLLGMGEADAVLGSPGPGGHTAFSHETSLLEVRAAMPADEDIVTIAGLHLYSLPAALIDAGPGFFPPALHKLRR